MTNLWTGSSNIRPQVLAIFFQGYDIHEGLQKYSTLALDWQAWQCPLAIEYILALVENQSKYTLEKQIAFETKAVPLDMYDWGALSQTKIG